MNIFVSHNSDESWIGKAWKEILVNTIDCDIFLSSDDSPQGGILPGRYWKNEILTQIESANYILVIITPASQNTLWVGFEAGIALGRKKFVIPIVYFMDINQIPSIYQDLQVYKGDEVKSVIELCNKLINDMGGQIPDSDKLLGLCESYLEKIKKEWDYRFFRTQYFEKFHNKDAAKRYSGIWYAKWTKQLKDGRHEVFEIDKLELWTTEHRVRFLGEAVKGGYYPMEGVVSWNGDMILSYWSQGEIPIYGSVLIRPIGGRMDILVGTWQGITAKNLDETPYFHQGKVVMSKRKEVVIEYWNLKLN